MTRFRLALPLVALLVAVAWLAYSVARLVGSATDYHVRVVARAGNGPLPPAGEVQRLLADQNHWGVLAMFAVAGVAAALVLTGLVWLSGGPRRSPPRRQP